MPLETSPSSAAFAFNIKAERKAGKPMKQALAIAYAKKREAGGQDKGETPYTGGTVGESVRHIDAKGHLHVELAHISKANVCPYKGDEIPNWKSLGLDAGKVYMLYRDPVELERGASTFNRGQLLLKHIPVSSAEPQMDSVVGCLGSDCVFNAPYLDCSLSVWTDAGKAFIEAADRGEAGGMKELSCGYDYRADMTPGTTTDGIDYDGVMRDIVGNHVTLVPAGRAGPDILVGDERAPWMSKRIDLLQSALKSDKPVDLTALLMAMDKARDEMEDGEDKARDKARDESEEEKACDEACREADPKGEDEAEEDYEQRIGKAKDAMRRGMDKMRARDKARDKARDESEEEKNKKEGEDRKGKDRARGKDEPPEFEGKPKDPAEDKRAMDAALARTRSETIAEMNAIRDAERAVRPYVGDIVIAMDSASDVYKFAAKTMGVDLAGIHPSAYRTVIDLHGRLNKQPSAPRLAYDSAMDGEELFPDARRIGQL